MRKSMAKTAAVAKALEKQLDSLQEKIDALHGREVDIKVSLNIAPAIKELGALIKTIDSSKASVKVGLDVDPNAIRTLMMALNREAFNWAEQGAPGMPMSGPFSFSSLMKAFNAEANWFSQTVSAARSASAETTGGGTLPPVALMQRIAENTRAMMMAGKQSSGGEEVALAKVMAAADAVAQQISSIPSPTQQGITGETLSQVKFISPKAVSQYSGQLAQDEEAVLEQLKSIYESVDEVNTSLFRLPDVEATKLEQVLAPELQKVAAQVATGVVNKLSTEKVILNTEMARLYADAFIRQEGAALGQFFKEGGSNQYMDLTSAVTKGYEDAFYRINRVATSGVTDIGGRPIQLALPEKASLTAAELQALSAYGPHLTDLPLANMGLGPYGPPAPGGGGGSIGGWITNALGFGAGGNNENSGIGQGIMNTLGLFGIGGRGNGGWTRFIHPFGILPGFGGLSLEHALLLGAGVAGNAAGGLLGGGLLALGGLGTMATGMGTNMAAMGQAASDTRALWTAQQQVSQAQLQYAAAVKQFGAGSAVATTALRNLQAAQANYTATLMGFPKAARGAIAGTTRALQGFRNMFDSVTGMAERYAAKILTSFIHVFRHFLPTLGHFAWTNMKIMTKGLHPLEQWLMSNKVSYARIPGVQLGTPGTTNFGIKGGPVWTKIGAGGLSIFRELEQLFTSRLPTGLQAMTRFFQLLMKTVAYMAPQVGKLLTFVDKFLGKANTTLGFSKWELIINKLVADFHIWWNLIKNIIKDVYYLFHADAGTAATMLKYLTSLLVKLGQYEKSTRGFQTMHSVFVIHKQELMAILHLIPSLARAFAGFYMAVMPPAVKMVTLIAKLIGWLMKIVHVPILGTLAKWGLAFWFLERRIKALHLLAAGLFKGLGYLLGKTGIGSAIGGIASKIGNVFGAGTKTSAAGSLGAVATAGDAAATSLGTLAGAADAAAGSLGADAATAGGAAAATGAADLAGGVAAVADTGVLSTLVAALPVAAIVTMIAGSILPALLINRNIQTPQVKHIENTYSMPKGMTATNVINAMRSHQMVPLHFKNQSPTMNIKANIIPVIDKGSIQKIATETQPALQQILDMFHKYGASSAFEVQTMMSTIVQEIKSGQLPMKGAARQDALTAMSALSSIFQQEAPGTIQKLIAWLTAPGDWAKFLQFARAMGASAAQALLQGWASHMPGLPTPTLRTSQAARSSTRAYASGGPVGPGQMAVVGERGPELLMMGASGGYVVPNHRLRFAASGAGEIGFGAFGRAFLLSRLTVGIEHLVLSIETLNSTLKPHGSVHANILGPGGTRINFSSIDTAIDNLTSALLGTKKSAGLTGSIKNMTKELKTVSKDLQSLDSAVSGTKKQGGLTSSINTLDHEIKNLITALEKGKKKKGATTLVSTAVTAPYTTTGSGGTAPVQVHYAPQVTIVAPSSEMQSMVEAHIAKSHINLIQMLNQRLG